MTIWLIMDSTNTVINVLDDKPAPIDPALTKIDQRAAPLGAWAGWRLGADGWSPPSQQEEQDAVNQILGLSSDKIVEVMSVLNKTQAFVTATSTMTAPSSAPATAKS